MRLIDAHKLINVLDGMREEFRKDGNVIYALLMCMVIQYIKNHHELDAEPIKHGKWENDVICSECGFYRQTTRSDNLMIGNYCPNCGANMDGKENSNVDWYKVAVDTPVLVSDDGEKWEKHHFAEYYNDMVWTWVSGNTSWTAMGKPICPWIYGKLADTNCIEVKTDGKENNNE